MTKKQLNIINLYLEPFLTQFGGFYKLINEEFIKYTQQMYTDDQAQYFYKNIGDALQVYQNSIRKIREQTSAYIKAREYFSVKQILSSIENFLVFFNPEHKLELYNLWNILINQTYDPVIEYNKSLELFVMHSQPTPHDLFKIVVQLSRFFVDIAEFEDSEIPEFRHPKIINRTVKGENDFLSDDDDSNHEKDNKVSEDLDGDLDDHIDKNDSVIHLSINYVIFRISSWLKS